jgi:hypothetical protein
LAEQDDCRLACQDPVALPVTGHGPDDQPEEPFAPLATKRVSLLPDLRGTMTVPTTLTTVLSTSSAPAIAATSRATIGAVISYP